MPRFPVALILCLSSYSPLFILIAMRVFSKERGIAISLIAVALSSIAVLVIFLAANRRRAPMPVTFKAVQQRDGDVMGYVITYLVPFANTSYRAADGSIDLLNLGSVCLLFAVIITIYISANLIFINPILALAGYRVYEVELNESGEKKALLTRSTVVRTSHSYSTISLGPYVLWNPET